MRRSTILVIVVLSAALAGIAFSSATERLRGDDSPPETSAPARPQRAQVDWRETYGEKGQQLVFEVEEIEVLREGWRVELAVTNDTDTAWEVGDPRATLDRAFGLRLFSTGSLAEVEKQNREGRLPTIRPATDYEPELPEVLEPHKSWRGTISAPGSLVAGSWVRVVFGSLYAVGLTPEGLNDYVVWTTDHTYRLRP